jgi:hypothetical protein
MTITSAMVSRFRRIATTSSILLDVRRAPPMAPARPGHADVSPVLRPTDFGG